MHINYGILNMNEIPPSAAPWNKAYSGTVFGDHWGLNIVAMSRTKPINIPMMAKDKISNT